MKVTELNSFLVVIENEFKNYEAEQSNELKYAQFEKIKKLINELKVESSQALTKRQCVRLKTVRKKFRKIECSTQHLSSNKTQPSSTIMPSAPKATSTYFGYQVEDKTLVQLEDKTLVQLNQLRSHLNSYREALDSILKNPSISAIETQLYYLGFNLTLHNQFNPKSLNDEQIQIYLENIEARNELVNLYENLKDELLLSNQSSATSTSTTQLSQNQKVPLANASRNDSLMVPSQAPEYQQGLMTDKLFASYVCPYANCSFDDFEQIEFCGSGQNSIVLKAWEKQKKRYVAIKVYYNVLDKSVLSEIVSKECRIYKKFDNPFIVKVYYSFSSVANTEIHKIIKDEGLAEDLFQNKLECAVMEYFDIDLKKYLSNEPATMTNTLITNVVGKICLALETMERGLLAHLDIKPDNLLINLDKNRLVTRVVLADFGVVKNINQVIDGASFGMLRFENGSCDSNLGATCQLAPEILNAVYENVKKTSGNNTVKVNLTAQHLFSVGVLAHTISKAIPEGKTKAFCDAYPEDFTSNGEIIGYSDDLLPLECHPALNRTQNDLLRACLSFEPSQRPSLRDMIEHFPIDQ